MTFKSPGVQVSLQPATLGFPIMLGVLGFARGLLGVTHKALGVQVSLHRVFREPAALLFFGVCVT